MSSAVDSKTTISSTNRATELRRVPPRHSAGKWVWALVVVLAVIIAPLVLSPYLTGIVILTAITSVPIASLTMLFGYAGQVSLGQAAFYGVGAYIYAILCASHGVNPWVGMASAVLVSAAFAYVVGRGLLRLRGYYLAMVTAALGVIAERCFSNLTGLTGGYSGITGIPPLTLPGVDLMSTNSLYYVLIALCAFALFVVRLLATGEYGRILRAMRESETVASAHGVSIPHAKAQIFAVSAGLAAFGGCLYAQYVQFVSPDNFTAALSIMFFLGAVIGGLTSIGGAVFGAAYVVVLPELVSSYSQWEVVITGVLTLVILLFAPKGLVELVKTLVGGRALSLRSRWRRTSGADGSGA